jgi:hypothetical protein
MNAPIVIVIVVLGVLSWFAGMYIMAQLGGWAALAMEFRATEVPSSKAYRFRSGSVGMANYGGCLTLCMTDRGLHISAGVFGMPLILWHPPLLIPWSEFHSTRKRTFLWWSSTVTYVGMPVIAQMTLPGYVADYIDRENR